MRAGVYLRHYLLYTLASQSFRGAFGKRQDVPQLPTRERHTVWVFVFLGHESKGQERPGTGQD